MDLYDAPNPYEIDLAIVSLTSMGTYSEQQRLLRYGAKALILMIILGTYISTQQ